MSRLRVFVIVFFFLNLAFIPLLSIYGLRVCPILSIPGFYFGCGYTGTFIFLVNTLNGVLLFFRRRTFNEMSLSSRYYLYSFGIYFLATLFALIVLQIMLHMNHLASHSRGPEILILASVLLGITQVYGLSWVKSDEKNSNFPVGLHHIDHSGDSNQLIMGRLWLFHMGRTLLPLIIVLILLLHFLLRQSVSINQATPPLASHDELIQQSALLILFLVIWLSITFGFHFLSEKDLVRSVSVHLWQMKQLNFVYRSQTQKAWGLWMGILAYLNSFAKAMGERSRLLKSFSQFVTASVAKQALDDDLDFKTGIMRELTVIMTDIRDFTSLSEKLHPHQVVHLLNLYFTEMLDVTVQFSITIDKFIGDGVLAYVDQESSTQSEDNSKAVSASIEMLNRVEKLNQTLPSQGLPTIKIGVGIYRGPVVLGVIGAAAKLQHTIIGDAVNRAARMESLCKELLSPIVISDSVWDSLDQEQKQLFRDLGKRPIKGLSESLNVFGLHPNY